MIDDIIAGVGIVAGLFLFGFLMFAWGYRTADTRTPFEQISEQQFRADTLQYLEDIRDTVRE